ncbi:hypothetical protein [Propionivibrio sp.]|uniref:hypothetical protein n=1 Tax=Propionivibrio sp. TaxID=2212460 RepID=UPI0039E4F3A2
MSMLQRLGFYVVLALACGSAEAASDPVTKEQYQLLPEYCRNQEHVARFLYRPTAEGEWRRRLGQDYLHIHHYCWGLVHMLNAYRLGVTSGKGRFQFEEAADDFRFSINATLLNGGKSPGSALLPEMYTKLGEALLGVRDYRNAEIAFRSSWEINPSYAPPYVWWAQALLKQGKTGEALAVAEEGKKNAPDSKSLAKLIEEIRGKGTSAKK